MATVPGDDEIFVVEQPGRLLRAHVDGDRWTMDDEPVLDLTSRIESGGNEQGLLGVAVSPDGSMLILDGTFKDGGGGRAVSRIVRWTLDDGVPDPASETVLLSQPQPHANHNGGQVAFGPDGFLYIGFGDGGSQDDPDGNGQRLDTLLGKLLRIDAAASTAERVAVPADNPFVGTAGARSEIWSYGLRNPWRFSFDAVTGDLWIGDVGGAKWEEVDHATAASGGGRGVNYGWQIREGDDDTSTKGDRTGLVDPVQVLSHDDGYCSLIGGFVSRDPRIPELWGSYLFTDACRGELHVLTAGRLKVHDEAAPGGGATTFGVGPSGELYVATLAGDIRRIDAG
jgi:glucose/arabinose dehydrogenase